MRWRIVVLAVCLGGVVAPSAVASQLIDRNAADVKLAVNSKGEALISYDAHGKLVHVLAWGAVNAIAPSPEQTQVAFQLDYAGGFGKYHTTYWQTFEDACRPYDGPELAWLVAACKAPDGSYWALQAWQRSLPDYGAKPSPDQAAFELRLSHWQGTPATLTVHVNWAYRKFDHLYGRVTYDGEGVFGFKSTSSGTPLDSFGRNVYVDTFGSSYGEGWARENSFLTHTRTGAFCYGFFPHAGRPPGKGAEYRATVIGPGVTPDVMWQGKAPGPYQTAAQADANEEIRALGDPRCHPV